MRRVQTFLNRRSMLAMLAVLGLADARQEGANACPNARHRGETRAVGFTRLVYTDADGRELAQMRPFAMLDLSDRADVIRVPGTRALGVSVKIWNTGANALTAPPAAFALWGAAGTLFRPSDVYAVLPSGESAAARHPYRHSLKPIPPGGARFGWLTYRLPIGANPRGLLFTPEPERILLLADFSTPSTSIVD